MNFYPDLTLLYRKEYNTNSFRDVQDKHAKQLADKLAARLPRCETERAWNDVAYALGLLQHKNEDITKLVGEGFKIVQAAA